MSKRLREDYRKVLAKTESFLLIALLLEVSTSFAYAFRPFRTEDAGTSPRGMFGIELGNEFSSKDNGKENFTTLALTYGLFNWIEAEIDIAFLSLNPESGQNEYGFGDTVLISKLKLLGENGVLSENDLLPEVVIVPSLLIPTGEGDKGLGAGDVEGGVLMAVEKPVWQITGRGNIGYLATNDPTFDRNFDDRFFYGLQIDFPVFIDRILLGTEITGEFGSNDGNPIFSLTGFAIEIKENLILDGGLEFGMKDAQSSISVIFGVTFGFNIFEEERGHS